jgi:protocatechuate 3,4-dioxygenase beta subunit
MAPGTGSLDEVDGALLDPPYAHAAYTSTALRAPRHSLLTLPGDLDLHRGPVFGERVVVATDRDLTLQGSGAPLGERITIEGRVLDRSGRAIAGSLVEIWQANASGRYAHATDDHAAPLDPNFTGYGRCVTDADGRYSFVTIRPGAYPWNNHANAWRPAHVHFSLLGRGFVDRLVTQMYFPGDPLLAFDPIFKSVVDARSRDRLVARFDLGLTTPGWALGYRFDIIAGGRAATPTE